jgi:hypothetical protein
MLARETPWKPSQPATKSHCSVGLALAGVVHHRLRALQAVQAHVLAFIDGGQAGGGAGLHQVAGDLGLSVHHHMAAGQAFEVDAVQRAVEGEFGAVVDQPFRVQPFADAGLAQQLHGGVLQHAGADAAEHVLAGALLEDDVVDAGLVQQLAEQQPRGPAPMMATWVREGSWKVSCLSWIKARR